MAGSRFGHAQAVFGNVLDHFQSTGKGESGILMGVHPAEILEVWVFGDFQFSRLSSDEPRIQRIEASQLALFEL
ncbi:hypothetical protein AWV80_17280 [Cupriavidus sp. UYMU48A]|nr:hypothetical protein AWV80_17280 [Cupriavidus sp. UYMU48A]